MGFKSMENYDEDRYGGMFRLINDGDYKDVIIMYRGRGDVLEADTHYIKSADFNGYVHCLGKNCPACKKGLRVQPKLFVPLYVISDKEILYFDRSVRFMSVLDNDVFKNYPNPSEYVFRVTRHGEANSVDTKYTFTAIAKNTVAPYDKILTDLCTSMPGDYYKICKEIDRLTMENAINNPDTASAGSTSDYAASYNAQPRNAASAPSTPYVPQTSVPAPSYNQPDENMPSVDGSSVDGDAQIGDEPNF